nr:thyroid hormone receptor interactor 10 [Hymenolepis microstoma]
MKMGTRSWGVELWDQVDNLLQFENDQLAVHDHHYRLLVEIQKLIAEFGKKYRKTVSSFVPKKRGNTTLEHKLTYNNVLIDSLASFIEMGMAFEGYGNELQQSVITPLKAEYDREKKITDKVTTDYVKYNSTREREKKKLEDTWRAHVNALKEKQKAEAQNTLAHNDPNISAEERQKAQAFLSAKQQAFVETQQSYAAEMSAFNNNQRFHFTHNIHVLIADLEMIDRQRARITQDLLSKCSDLGDALAKKLSDSAISLRKTVSRIDPEEDCKTVLEARKTEYLFPVDLPFLNLSQCTQATLENQSALVKLMLGSSNGYTVKSTEKASKGGLHTLFGKSKSQTSDGNILQTPFIAGIGYKPVKEADMTVIQLNERIMALKSNLEKVQNTIGPTQRLLESCKSNPKLGNLNDTEDAVAKLYRQTFSLDDLIKRLEARYESMGGDQALAAAKSSLECTNPYGISEPLSRLESLQKSGSRSEPAYYYLHQQQSSATQNSDSETDDPVSPTHKGDYVGEATLKYDCEGNDDGCISGKAGEVFYVLEEDNDGSGWTAVVSSDGLRQGFLPTTHMDITLY